MLVYDESPSGTKPGANKLLKFHNLAVNLSALWMTFNFDGIYKCSKWRQGNEVQENDWSRTKRGAIYTCSVRSLNRALGGGKIKWDDTFCVWLRASLMLVCQKKDRGSKKSNKGEYGSDAKWMTEGRYRSALPVRLRGQREAYNRCKCYCK